MDMLFAFSMPAFLTVLTVVKRGFLIMLCLLAFSSFSSLSYAGMIDQVRLQPWEICAMWHNANGLSRMARVSKLAGSMADYIDQLVLDLRYA